MVLIANGGLGSAFDELELNRVLCHHYNVRVAGVIINKVMPDKLEQTKEYLGKALMQSWGVPLLGCIPDRPFLGCPALSDFENLFETRLVSGSDSRFRHYSVGDITVVTTSLTRYVTCLQTYTLYGESLLTHNLASPFQFLGKLASQAESDTVHLSCDTR